MRHISNLLGSLEGMIITGHVGHNGSLIRLWCVDQIYFRQIAHEYFLILQIYKKVSYHLDPTCVGYLGISQPHRMRC